MNKVCWRARCCQARAVLSQQAHIPQAAHQVVIRLAVSLATQQQLNQQAQLRRLPQLLLGLVYE